MKGNNTYPTMMYLSKVFFLFLISFLSSIILINGDDIPPLKEEEEEEVTSLYYDHPGIPGRGDSDKQQQQLLQERRKRSSSNRKLGIWGAIEDVFTGCPDGDVGDDCSAICPCQNPNSCEAFTHICQPPGNENDSCSFTRPCRDDLYCDVTMTTPPSSPTCKTPGNENESCSFTRPCRDDLFCEGGSNICKPPGKHGDLCHLTRPCSDGYWCVDAITAWNYQMCLPDCTTFTSSTQTKLVQQGYSTDAFPGFDDEKWSNGIIPFQADCELENNESALFAQAMKHIEDNTDIRFVRYDPNIHDNWIVLTDIEDDAANSWVGKMNIPGWQRVNLDTDWFNLGHDLGSAIHELVHALGWQHTQARPDRDDYVTVITGNVQPNSLHNFNIEVSNVYGSVQRCRDYDYDSIMHYSGSAFSVNGELTIVTKDPNKQDDIGQRDSLSEQDIIEINEYYFGSPLCINGTETDIGK